MRRIVLFAILLVFILTGCSLSAEDENVIKVDRFIPANQDENDPANYIGQFMYFTMDDFGKRPQITMFDSYLSLKEIDDFYAKFNFKPITTYLVANKDIITHYTNELNGDPDLVWQKVEEVLEGKHNDKFSQYGLLYQKFVLEKSGQELMMINIDFVKETITGSTIVY